jgi:hypothetical protein
MEQRKGVAGRSVEGSISQKKVGAYRIVFQEFPSRGVAEIAAILIKSKDTYK